MEKEAIGTMLLGMTGAWGIWSAANPSTFTILKFSENDGDRQKIKTGMNVGLACILAMGSGIALLYGKKGYIPAAATIATGVGLYMWYSKKLTENANSLTSTNGSVLF